MHGELQLDRDQHLAKLDELLRVCTTLGPEFETAARQGRAKYFRHVGLPPREVEEWRTILKIVKRETTTGNHEGMRCRLDLAESLARAGQTEAVEREANGAVAWAAETFGAENLTTPMIRGNRGVVWVTLRKFQDACPDLEAAIAGTERMAAFVQESGSESVCCAHAHALHSLGRSEEAVGAATKAHQALGRRKERRDFRAVEWEKQREEWAPGSRGRSRTDFEPYRRRPITLRLSHLEC